MIKYSLINILMDKFLLYQWAICWHWKCYLEVLLLDTVLVEHWLISSSTSLQRVKHPHNPGKHEIPKRWPHEAADRGVCCEINSERVCVSKAYIFFILFSLKQPQGGRLKRGRDQLLISNLISLPLSPTLSIYIQWLLFFKKHSADLSYFAIVCIK